MQKQKGKLVISKSGVFHIWHIVYVIKILVSPEERKMDFFKISPRAKSVP